LKNTGTKIYDTGTVLKGQNILVIGIPEGTGVGTGII
jgi:hypothetical protein